MNAKKNRKRQNEILQPHSQQISPRAVLSAVHALANRYTIVSKRAAKCALAADRCKNAVGEIVERMRSGAINITLRLTADSQCQPE